MNHLKLRELQDQDIELFKTWLYKEHVAKWYHEPDDWMYEMEHRKDEFSWIHYFIVESNEVPIGFCQYYLYENSGETWHGDIDLEGTYSIDYMIGNPDYLHQGNGKKLIMLLLEELRALPSKRVIGLPELENQASCATLLSCGFVFDEKNQLFLLEL